MTRAPKPQDSPEFRQSVPIDNSRGTPFSPKPWDGRPSRPGVHPFQNELDALIYSREQINAPTAPRAFPKILTSSTSGWSFVDDSDSLSKFAADLAKEPSGGAIAVDLEHHSFRSFQGLTCLAQVSTTRHDWIIDCLAPAVRLHFGKTIGPIFSNPLITKVLHGANSDVGWLQRDFGVFIVNLFDTGQASRALGYPSAGLAYLLERHTGAKDIVFLDFWFFL